LLNKGASPNKKDANKNTLLHILASNTQTHLEDLIIELIKTLLNYGGDNNIQNKEGKTPFEVCLFLNNITVIRMFVNTSKLSKNPTILH